MSKLEPQDTAFDWPGLLRAGLRGAGLQPRDFWQLTPIELMVLLGRDGGAAPLSRDRFEALLMSYPDKTGDGDG